MKPLKTWIVLADASKLRIVANDGPNKGLYPIAVDATLVKGALPLSDEPGLTKAPAGPNRGNIADPDLKSQSEDLFARSIVRFVDEAGKQNAFNRLIIAAPPEMLGCIRKHVSPDLKALLRTDLAKDLTSVPMAKLHKHLEDFLPV